MAYHNKPYPNLKAALNNQTVPDLKKLAGLLSLRGVKTAKKGELVETIQAQTLDNLETIWRHWAPTIKFTAKGHTNILGIKRLSGKTGSQYIFKTQCSCDHA